MKKGLLFLIGALVLLAAGALFFTVSPKTAASLVVVSGYVPYTLVSEISGGNVKPEMLLPPGAEPHSFEPAPGTMVAVHNARAFIYVSNQLEPWAKDVLGAAGPQTRVVALADNIPPQDDPHVWMDFDPMRQLARTVADVLTDMDPANASVYEKNLKQFEQQISTLDSDFARQLSSCESREVVHVGHLAFGGLAKRYHLSLTALTGTSHDGEHSPRKLAELIKHIRRARVKALFTEDALSPRLAQTVAAETGTQILPLYTVEDVSKDDFTRGVTYEELMRRNLASLTRGLSCKK